MLLNFNNIKKIVVLLFDGSQDAFEYPSKDFYVQGFGIVQTFVVDKIPPETLTHIRHQTFQSLVAHGKPPAS